MISHEKDPSSVYFLPVRMLWKAAYWKSIGKMKHKLQYNLEIYYLIPWNDNRWGPDFTEFCKFLVLKLKDIIPLSSQSDNRQSRLFYISILSDRGSVSSYISFPLGIFEHSPFKILWVLTTGSFEMMMNFIKTIKHSVKRFFRLLIVITFSSSNRSYVLLGGFVVNNHRSIWNGQ